MFVQPVVNSTFDSRNSTGDGHMSSVFLLLLLIRQYPPVGLTQGINDVFRSEGDRLFTEKILRQKSNPLVAYQSDKAAGRGV